jgi:PAS domain S-box-containing protein
VTQPKPTHRPTTLEEAQEYFRLLVAGVREHAVFLMDKGGHIKTWNAGAQIIKGYRAEEILGQHFSKFYLPEEVAAGKPARELVIAEKDGHYREEGWRVRKDGSLFWASVTISAVRDEEGTLNGFLKITRDLTDRKRAEDALRESEEKFRLMVEAVKDYAVFMLDPKGNIASWNPGAERIKGYTADEVIGSHFSRFYTKPDVDSGKPARELAIAEKEGRYQEEGWRVRKDGTTFWAGVTITPIRDEEGKLRGFAKVTQDLTQRLQTAQQQAQLLREQAAREEAEKTNRIKDEFLAVLSHELRTPLNAIVGWAHLLRSSPTLAANQVGKGLEAIERNANIQTQIVSDVLDVSRMTSGKVRLSPRRVDAGEVLAAAMDTVRPAADAKGLEFKANLPQAPVFVYADGDRLQQIMWNLLQNAVKFTSSGGRVEANLSRRASHVEFAITDTGAGVDPEFLPYMFDSFRQADSSASRKHGGLGLGLAIVKRLVELHGGQVEAASEGPGRGTTVTVRLPLMPLTTAVGPGTVENVRPPARLEGVSVLVVDDHADTRELVGMALGQSGATVTSAGDAAAALTLLREQRPDVLVCDLEMPGESGYDLIRKVRSLNPSEGGLTPAIALTAYARDEDRVRTLAEGFQRHIAKPAKPDDLTAAVAALVGTIRIF